VAELTANGHRFFVLRLGAGDQTAVFVHGLGMDNLSSWWLTVANAAARSCDVVCYDLRGHGRSEMPETGYSISDSVADLSALLDALGIEHPVHVIGNSYGGSIGLAFALAHPGRTAGLVLVEAHAAIEGQTDGDRENVENWAAQAREFDVTIVDEWLDQLGNRKLRQIVERAKDLIHDTTLVDDLRTSPPFTASQLASISCPVLLLYGEESHIFSRAIVLEAMLPNAELRVLEGIDHQALMSATPRVRREILDWLAVDRVVRS
jgi:pimeloyl-ACP methyl ester carboxylesterase